MSIAGVVDGSSRTVASAPPTESAARAVGPDVRLVPVRAIRPHEEYTPSREQALSAEIAREGVLRHPLIVAELGDGEYVLLDGTHRLEWLVREGQAFAPVQVVRPDDPTSVAVHTWAHLAQVSPLFPDEVQEAVGAEGGLVLEATTPRRALAVVAAGLRPAWLAAYGQRGVAYTVRGPGNRARVLRALLGHYRPERIAPEEACCAGHGDPEAVFAHHRSASLVVHFAPFGAEDVAALAREGDRVPAGITRVVVVGGRVLGLNVRLGLLGRDADPAAQRAWLAELAERCPRPVAGPALVYEPTPRRYAEPLLVYDRELPVV